MPLLKQGKQIFKIIQLQNAPDRFWDTKYPFSMGHWVTNDIPTNQFQIWAKRVFKGDFYDVIMYYERWNLTETPLLSLLLMIEIVEI